MTRWIKTCCTLLICAMTALHTVAQTGTGCQPNIGFEGGNFQNWLCFTGHIERTGTITMNPAAPPVNNVHTIIPRSAGNTFDRFGKFPITPPNGSNYSIRLGNEDVNAEAERVSYTFTIPPGQNTYSIIYSYAVVLENPNHTELEQPRFRAEVIDVTAGSPVNCGSFDYTATLDIPGFEVSTINNGVFFKPWSSVTVNLNNMAGRSIRIIFTSNDCSQGGHFGYAYVDVSENCSNHIQGNRYCPGMNSITLTGPTGFESYTWYNAGFTQVLGRAPFLTMTPPPPDNTVIALVIKPITGVGCPDTLYTTVNAVNDPFVLNVKDTVQACLDPGADITVASITAGSSPGLTFSYYEDAAMLKPVATPEKLVKSGTYYIRGRNAIGCSQTKPVYVSVINPSALKVKSPFLGCEGQAVDLTDPVLTAGSEPGLTYTYWMDNVATVPLAAPNNVTAAGTYYVKGSSALGCFTVQSVTVEKASLNTAAVSGCGTADLAMSTTGSSAGLQYSYWEDAACTIPVTDPSKLTTSGHYFIRAQANSGCVLMQNVMATVKPLPFLTIVDPPAIELPATIDLNKTATTNPGATLSFWKNAQGTIALKLPSKMEESGTYYIRSTLDDCSVTKPVTIKLFPPPPPVVAAPNAFSPNGDGVNDLFYITLNGRLNLKGFRIFNRFGQEVFHSMNLQDAWDGRIGNAPAPFGTYYWVMEGYDIYRKKSWYFNGSITLLR